MVLEGVFRSHGNTRKYAYERHHPAQVHGVVHVFLQSDRLECHSLSTGADAPCGKKGCEVRTVDFTITVEVRRAVAADEHANLGEVHAEQADEGLRQAALRDML